ncbi:MAG: glucosaminidase domain-containing protein [Saprospiraceae bacterium]
MMKTLLPCAMAVLLLLNSATAAVTNLPPHVTRYIETYNDIAVREMQRSGIPASVILAQGIHESSWGLGELSTNSNNHFGIKCKSIWNGPTYYIEDDDYVNGVLTKSCFRVYNSVEESYIDHTNFLVEGDRYQTLFSYDPTDYVNWSKGLKACGYATDPNYAKKLIRTIEKYNLTRFDQVNTPVISAPVYTIPLPEPMPQQAEPHELNTDLTIPPSISSIVNSTTVETSVTEELEPKPVADEDIPAAVNIDEYMPNSNNTTESITTTDSENYSSADASQTGNPFTNEMEEEEESSTVEETYQPVVNYEVATSEPEPTAETTNNAIPPNYQMEALPRTESPAPEPIKSKEDLSATKRENNHLQLMKGKVRIRRAPRR